MASEKSDDAGAGPSASARGAGVRNGRVSRPQREALTHARIVHVARDMIDQAGLDSFSMRKLGSELGADPMAVYHYFPSKAALFDAIVEATMLEIDLGGEAPSQWDEAVAHMVYRMRDAMRAHPKALPLIATRPVSTPPVLGLIEIIAARLAAAGAKPVDALMMVNCLAMYTIGHLLAEVGDPVGGPEGDSGDYSAIDPAAVPTLVAAMAAGWAFDADATYDAGLRSMIAGFAARFGLRD